MSTHSTLSRVCEHCGKHFFLRWPNEAKGGGGRFCSCACFRGWQKDRPMADRFWPKVNKDGPIPAHMPHLGPCWLWTGTPSNRYGALGADHTGKMIRAHRASWEIHFGPVPDNLFVLHRCDAPLCVNPAHLFLGTQQDNMDDMAAKRRQAKGEKHGLHLHPEAAVRGEKHGRSKLSDAQVESIRSEYATGTVSQRAIGSKHGITGAHVSNIVRRKNRAE